MEEIILTVIISLVSIIIIVQIIIYVILRKKFQSVDKINESTLRLDGTVSTIQSLSNTLFKQVDDVKVIQTDLKLSFQNFYDMLIMKPSVRGRVGEGIVKFILSSFPENLWQEQCEISGCGIVDFAIFMPPDNRILPMDSKFSLPQDFIPDGELREGDLIFMNKDQRKKANLLVINRTKEVRKYINPTMGTMNFALIFIPDSVYLALTNDTLRELQSNKVIPVNTSGLISTLFLIERQYVSIKISEAVNRLEDIKSTLENEFLTIGNILATAEKQGENSNKNIRKALSSLKKAENNILETFGLLEE
ncbi:MAG: DNA recombination protein RmuC [Candidatus Thorarchaeota archaeon]